MKKQIRKNPTLSVVMIAEAGGVQVSRDMTLAPRNRVASSHLTARELQIAAACVGIVAASAAPKKRIRKVAVLEPTERRRDDLSLNPTPSPPPVLPAAPRIPLREDPLIQEISTRINQKYFFIETDPLKLHTALRDRDYLSTHLDNREDRQSLLKDVDTLIARMERKAVDDKTRILKDKIVQQIRRTGNARDEDLERVRTVVDQAVHDQQRPEVRKNILNYGAAGTQSLALAVFQTLTHHFDAHKEYSCFGKTIVTLDESFDKVAKNEIQHVIMSRRI